MIVPRACGSSCDRSGLVFEFPAAEICQAMHRETVLVTLAPIAQPHDVPRKPSARFLVRAVLEHRAIDVEGAQNGRQCDFMGGSHMKQRSQSDVVPWKFQMAREKH